MVSLEYGAYSLPGRSKRHLVTRGLTMAETD